MMAAAVAGSRQRVLVVEDEQDVCQVVSDALDAGGLEPVCVGSDREAVDTLRRARRQRFACLVVDVNLGPGTTGYDVARFARMVDPGLPVLYVSGQTSAAMFEGNSVEESLFLAKPFTPRELLRKIGRLIGASP